MSIRLRSPRFSFVQFGESNLVTSCNFADIDLCLPVFDENDVNFQFYVDTDTIAEADDLTDLQNDLIEVGIADDCASGMLINYKTISGLKPVRFRISDRVLLYNWSHGLPNFDTVISVRDCFVIKVIVDGNEYCSNCFQRIRQDCHTSVIEYGNDDNAFDFNYCNSGGVDPAVLPCDPTFISFTNQSTLVIPYTALLLAQYGNAPTVQVWIYDTTGELVNMGIRAAFDSYPPNELSFSFGGTASGIIKIM